MDNPENTIFVAKTLGVAIGIFFGLCFLIGVLFGPTEIKSLTIPDKIDIGYISEASNAYQYTTYGGSSALKAEQDEIKRLRNKVTKMKLERQLAEQLEIERLVVESKRQRQQVKSQPKPQSKPIEKKHPLFDDCSMDGKAKGG